MRRTATQLQQSRAQASRESDSRDVGELFRSVGEIVRSFDSPVTLGQKYNYATLERTLESHIAGTFCESGKLADMIIADDMISGTLESRFTMVASLLHDGHSLQIEPASMGGSTANEVCQWWRDRLLRIVDSSVLESINRDSILMSFSLHQIRYDGPDGWDCPVLERWHPSLTWYNVTQRNLMAITSNNGSEPISPHGGKWLYFSPYSYYMGYVQAGIRKLGRLWLIKEFALRDWSRYSTVYGNLIKILKHPAKVGAPEKAQMMTALKNLGTEGIFPAPQGDGAGRSFDLTLLAPPTGSPDVFRDLVLECDQKITQYILGQDATTNMKGGAYNAVGVAFAGLTLGKARRDVIAINDRLFPQLVGSITRTLWGTDILAPTVRILSDKIEYSIGDTGGPESAPNPEPTGGPQKQGKEAPPFGTASNTLPGAGSFPKAKRAK